MDNVDETGNINKLMHFLDDLTSCTMNSHLAQRKMSPGVHCDLHNTSLDISATYDMSRFACSHVVPLWSARVRFPVIVTNSNIKVVQLITWR